MSIQVHATYQGGVLYLKQPLPYPDGTRLDVTVAVEGGAAQPDIAALPEQVTQPEGATRPEYTAPPGYTPPPECTSADDPRALPPRITAEEFRERIKKYAISAGVSLPPDFSREDIYEDDDYRDVD